QAAIGRGFGHLHEIRDQAGIIARLVDFCARIPTPAAAAPLVAKAFAAMTAGRPGPAVLECAIDVWGRSSAVAPIAPPSPVPPPPIDGHALEQAAERLMAAQRPLIIVGGGAQDAAGEVTELSRVLQAPVLAYRRGRGVLGSHKHPSRRAEMEQRQANMRQRLAKLAPQIAFLDAIRAELPEDGIFVDEVTQIGFAARLLFPVYKPRTFLSPGYQDSLGWGF